MLQLNFKIAFCDRFRARVRILRPNLVFFISLFTKWNLPTHTINAKSGYLSILCSTCIHEVWNFSLTQKAGRDDTNSRTLNCLSSVVQQQHCWLVSSIGARENLWWKSVLFTMGVCLPTFFRPYAYAHLYCSKSSKSQCKWTVEFFLLLATCWITFALDDLVTFTYAQ